MQERVKVKQQIMEKSLMSRNYFGCQPVRCMAAWLKHRMPAVVIWLMAVCLMFLGPGPARGDEPPQPPAGGTSNAQVSIDNFSFSPKELTVAVGTTVTWTNHDDVPHVVASADDQFQKSGGLDTDESFSHTFTVAGNYLYFCSIHPHMTGKIIVK